MNLHFIVQYEILIRLYGGRRLTTSRSQLGSCFHEDCFANYCHASEKIPDDSAFMNDGSLMPDGPRFAVRPTDTANTSSLAGSNYLKL